jgi:hypothetical protein
MNDFRKSKSFYRPLIIADKTQFLFFIDHFDFMLFTGMSLPFSLKTPSFILYKSCLSLTSTMYLLLFVEFQFIFLWGVLVLLILVPPPPSADVFFLLQILITVRYLFDTEKSFFPKRNFLKRKKNLHCMHLSIACQDIIIGRMPVSYLHLCVFWNISKVVTLM